MILGFADIEALFHRRFPVRDAATAGLGFASVSASGRILDSFGKTQWASEFEYLRQQLADSKSLHLRGVWRYLMIHMSPIMNRPQAVWSHYLTPFE